MLRNLAQKVKAVLVLAAQTITADTTTTSVDLQEFRNFAFQVLVGAFAFTGVNKIGLKLQESDDNTTFTDAPAEAYYNGGMKELTAAGDASTVHLVQYRGNKRYARLVLDVSGTVSVAVAVSGLSTELKAQPL